MNLNSNPNCKKKKRHGEAATVALRVANGKKTPNPFIRHPSLKRKFNKQKYDYKKRLHFFFFFESKEEPSRSLSFYREFTLDDLPLPPFCSGIGALL